MRKRKGNKNNKLGVDCEWQRENNPQRKNCKRSYKYVSTSLLCISIRNGSIKYGRFYSFFNFIFGIWSHFINWIAASCRQYISLPSTFQCEWEKFRNELKKNTAIHQEGMKKKTTDFTCSTECKWMGENRVDFPYFRPLPCTNIYI